MTLMSMYHNLNNNNNEHLIDYHLIIVIKLIY